MRGKSGNKRGLVGEMTGRGKLGEVRVNKGRVTREVRVNEWKESRGSECKSA